jgi:hypothetical protein
MASGLLVLSRGDEGVSDMGELVGREIRRLRIRADCFRILARHTRERDFHLFGPWWGLAVDDRNALIGQLHCVKPAHIELYFAADVENQELFPDFGATTEAGHVLKAHIIGHFVGMHRIVLEHGLGKIANCDWFLEEVSRSQDYPKYSPLLIEIYRPYVRTSAADVDRRNRLRPTDISTRVDSKSIFQADSCDITGSRGHCDAFE